MITECKPIVASVQDADLLIRTADGRQIIIPVGDMIYAWKLAVAINDLAASEGSE